MLTLAFWFWLLMFAWLVVGIWWGTTAEPQYRWHVSSWSIVLFLLFLIVGWKLFQGPVHSG